MTEHMLRIRSARAINGRREPVHTGVMIDMEKNQNLELTPYESGQIAAVLSGEKKPRKEQVIHLHQDNTPERTVSAALVDLKKDQTQPLNPGDAEKIAKVVQRIEKIEASGEHAEYKKLLRSGFEFGTAERTMQERITGKPPDRNLI